MRGLNHDRLPLIIVFVLAIIVMIVAISKFKVHPFLSIMGASLILALGQAFSSCSCSSKLSRI